MKTIKYKIWFDEEKDTLRIQILKKLTEEDLFKMMDIVNEITEGKPEPNILIDMTEAPTDVLDEELIRKYENAMQHKHNDSDIEHATKPENWNYPRIFRNNQEALEWLKGN